MFSASGLVYPVATSFFGENVNNLTLSRVLVLTLNFKEVLTLCFVQVRVQAQDGGAPPRSRAAILTVNMLRNLETPVFNPNATYSATVLETQPIARSILRVRATDADAKPPHNRVSYELSNEYFTIDDQGTISLKRSLLEDGTEEYRVSYTDN